MIPVLYANNETQFVSQGIGALSDCISCVVTEERNGVFELHMEYPESGLHVEDLILRNIILAKPSPSQNPQPFRIYEVDKAMDDVVEVNAQHISYDLSGIAVEPFQASTLDGALLGLTTHSTTSNPFTLESDMTKSGLFVVETPKSLRAMLGGVQGSLLDVYGGEYLFDKYSVHLLNSRGSDNGVVIRYGKDLVDIKQEENCASTYTGVYPYWYSEQDGLVELSSVKADKVIYVSDSPAYERIMTLDLTQKFSQKPTPQELRSEAESYIVSNNIGVPNASLSISYEQNASIVDSVSLCDTVHVEFEAMNVSANATVIKTVYNTIYERFESVDIGNPKSNFAETIANQYEKVKDINSYVVEQSVIYKKQIEDLITETRSSIEAIYGGDDGRSLSFSEVKQTLDTIQTTIIEGNEEFYDVKTAAGFSQEWINTNQDGIRELLSYIKGRIVDGKLVISIGDDNDTHPKINITYDKISFTNGEFEDPSSVDLAFLSQDMLNVPKTNSTEFLQIQNLSALKSWRILEEDDGDLIFMLA